MKVLRVFTALTFALAATIPALMVYSQPVAGAGACNGSSLPAVCLKRTTQNRPPPNWFECHAAPRAWGGDGNILGSGVAATIDVARGMALRNCSANGGVDCVITGCGHPCQTDCGG